MEEELRAVNDFYDLIAWYCKQLLSYEDKGLEMDLRLCEGMNDEETAAQLKHPASKYPADK